MITTEQLKLLRDETGVSVMQCKKALEEAGGDMEKARIILKKKSGDAAAKKADRSLGSGIIVTMQNGQKAVILSLLCETDFVAKNEDFLKTAKALVTQVLNEGKEKTETYSIAILNELIQKIGENIKLGEIVVVEDPNVGIYNHNGQFASLVVLKNADESLAKDIAMHVTAMKPAYLSEKDISDEARQKAKETFQKETDEQSLGKPEEIKTKILEGKVNSYFAEQVLVKQAFIKDPNKTVGQLIKDAGNEIVSFKIVQI